MRDESDGSQRRRELSVALAMSDDCLSVCTYVYIYVRSLQSYMLLARCDIRTQRKIAATIHKHTGSLAKKNNNCRACGTEIVSVPHTPWQGHQWQWQRAEVKLNFQKCTKFSLRHSHSRAGVGTTQHNTTHAKSYALETNKFGARVWSWSCEETDEQEEAGEDDVGQHGVCG